MGDQDYAETRLDGKITSSLILLQWYKLWGKFQPALVEADEAEVGGYANKNTPVLVFAIIEWNGAFQAEDFENIVDGIAHFHIVFGSGGSQVIDE